MTIPPILRTDPQHRKAKALAKRRATLLDKKCKAIAAELKAQGFRIAYIGNGQFLERDTNTIIDLPNLKR